MQASPPSDDSERMERLRKRINAALCTVILGGAALLFVYLVSTRPDPVRQAPPQQVREVEVATVELCTFEAPVVGHGNVRATSPLRIVPEVGGALVQVHKDLAVGKRIAEGEVLFEIDARSYQAEADASQSEIKRLEASLAQLRQEELALRDRVENAHEQLSLATENRVRERDLIAGKATTEVERVAADMAYLKAKELVLQCENQLAQNPHRISEIEALLDMQRIKLAEARRRVEKTRIVCPFDARVESVGATLSQVVVAGVPIAGLTDLETMELAVGVDPSDLRWTPAWNYLEGSAAAPVEPPQARVIWTVDEREYVWSGAITRLERLDEFTRAARVVIEIRNAADEATLENGLVRPALSVGMFCRVEIPAVPLQQAIVVPRSAVQTEGNGGVARFVHVFEPDSQSPDGLEGRLAMRPVELLRVVEDSVLVSHAAPDGDRVPRAAAVSTRGSPLQVGELVVLSPLPWAVEGMKLRRQADASSVGSLSHRLADADLVRSSAPTKPARSN